MRPSADQSSGVTVVTGNPIPETLLGRSIFSHRETRGESVEMMISSKPRRFRASCTAAEGSGSPTRPSTGPGRWMWRTAM